MRGLEMRIYEFDRLRKSSVFPSMATTLPAKEEREREREGYRLGLGVATTLLPSHNPR